MHIFLPRITVPHSNILQQQMPNLFKYEEAKFQNPRREQEKDIFHCEKL